MPKRQTTILTTVNLEHSAASQVNEMVVGSKLPILYAQGVRIEPGADALINKPPASSFSLQGAYTGFGSLRLKPSLCFGRRLRHAGDAPRP